uniref:Uncharacterized protein LOC104220067 isoform X2 n=1 Tax=Nicotiana sylvestris TaxID=4096 RepID=A0A1U7W4G7_NICSY|nr:PREDICTED: uncharacterized protein LOC104220067 isoform X2 [Nicotiana sylvestris]
MDSRQTTKRPCSGKKCLDQNVKRREQYKLKMANKKSALALQEVPTKQVPKHSPFERVTSIIPTKITTTSGYLQCTTTKDSCSTPKIDSDVTILPSFPAFDKENPLCTYEKGSTSTAPNEQYDTTKIVITRGGLNQLPMYILFENAIETMRFQQFDSEPYVLLLPLRRQHISTTCYQMKVHILFLFQIFVIIFGCTFRLKGLIPIPVPSTN